MWTRFLLVFYIFSILIAYQGFALDPLDHRDGYIQPKMDATLRESAMALNVMEEHFKAYLSYTVNQMTPGYKEYAFANRYKNNNLEAIKFYRLGQGPPVETRNPLDCMVEGRGFFMIQGPWGYGYTRDGRFEVDDSGRLVTFTDRFPVLGEGGQIFVQSRNIEITKSGLIKDGNTEIDVLKIVDFIDFSNLDSFNASIFYVTKGDPVYTPNRDYRIRQGWYEGSSVVQGLVGEIARFKHVYEASTLCVKRIIKGYQAALSIAGQ